MAADDPLEAVSGTNGVTGAADAVLVLNRGAKGTTLYGRGRDIEDIETATRVFGVSIEVCFQALLRKFNFGIVRAVFDPRQTLRLTLARCALVRTIGRDRLTSPKVQPHRVRWQSGKR